MAKITGLPGENLDEIRRKFAWEEQYWTDKKAKERAKHLVPLELQYTKRITNKPVLKDELEAAGLGNLLILKMPRATIYKVTKECETIKKMVGTR